MKMNEVRASFPQASSLPVYLDSGATTLKAKAVIDRMSKFFMSEVSNVHRGAHSLGDAATTAFEGVRIQVAQFLNAKSENEIIFTRSTTESINLVAASLAQDYFKAGDEIIVTQLDHHSNIVPWQMWAERKGLKVHFVRIQEDCSLDFEHYKRLLGPLTKMVAMTQLSNALGVHVDVKPYIDAAHKVNALFLIDAAQSVSSHAIDVQALDCDFLAFSGHKLFAPTGVGVLYGKKDLLDAMPPYQAGGSMIDRVTEQGATYLASPQRFEAGTPAIAEVLGLGAALGFFTALNWKEIEEYDQNLIGKATRAISDLGFKVFAKDVPRSHVVSFIWPGMHPSDFASILSQAGVAVRSGHHCCQPLMTRLKIPGTIRASFSIYSNESDIEKLVEGLKKAKELLL